MLICFCAQIGKVDIAIFQTRNRENFKTGHHCAGGQSVARGSVPPGMQRAGQPPPKYQP